MALKFKSIKAKLTFAVGCSTVMIIIALITYVTVKTKNREVEATKQQMLAHIETYALGIETEIEAALYASRALANTFSVMTLSDSSVELTRDIANAVLVENLRKNPSFFGMYTLWEPNAFDGDDEKYVNAKGHDASGRFIPYWTRDSQGHAVLEPLKHYETSGIGNYYQIPKATHQETITPPYIYSVQGMDVMMVSLVVPVMNDDAFCGIVGADISVDWIQSFVEKESFFGKKAQVAVISNDGMVVAVSDRPGLRGKPLGKLHEDWQDDLKYIQDGIKIFEEDEGRYAAFIPIQIGQCNTPWSVNINIPQELVVGSAIHQMWEMIILGVFFAVAALLFIMLLTARITRPLRLITASIGKISKGDLSNVGEYGSDDEIGQLSKSIVVMVHSLQEVTSVCESVAQGDFGRSVALRSDNDVLGQSINEMSDTLRAVVQQANAIAGGDYTTEIQPRSDKDELGVALVEMTTTLRETTEENEKQNWLMAGQAETDDAMRGEQEIDVLASAIISKLAMYLDSQIGALYLCDADSHLKLVASYAYKKRKNVSNTLAFGEGIVGQAAIEKKSILMTQVPDDYIAINSGLGEASPRNILVVPLIFEQKIKGVIELGAFNEFSDIEIEFLEKAADGIAIALNSSESRKRVTELLEKTQRQSEELQVQQEELRATNEELEGQTESLKRSEKSLKSQQEELEIINAELEEKTDSLEKQKRELVKARNEIEAKAEDLALTSKYKSEFLSNMSHELRTPLNSLLILAKMLADNKQENLTGDQVKSAQVIYEGGMDLLSLINDILDLSKVESGKMRVNIENVKISDLAGNIKKNFEHMTREKGLSLKVCVSDDIRESIKTDRMRIEQVLKNLISNAIKFTEKGHITVAIKRPDTSIDLSRSGLDASQAIAFEVSDTGIGISPENQKVIFEAFQQADGSTSRKYGGTGLGLSISREFAGLLGGEIVMHSERGQGSTFILYVPFELEEQVSGLELAIDKKPQAVLAEAIAPSEKLSRSTRAQRPDDRNDINPEDRTVLVIDDDEKFSGILQTMAHEKGFKCLVAPDGKTGLIDAIDHRPDAIILDIGLPDIDGFAVMNALKDNPQTRHIPVHFISARDIDRDVFGKGAIGFLSKPVTEDALDDAFEKLQDLITSTIKQLLIVEDDQHQRESIVKLINDDHVNITAVETGQQAYAELKDKNYDCMVLDLGLPDMSGFDLLSKISTDSSIAKPPVIVYSGKDLTHEEDIKIREYADSIIIKGAASPERLLDETALFLHRVETELPEKQQRMIRMLHDKESVLKGKKILLVDDDIRNIFALSHALKDKGLIVNIAENGKNALDILAAQPDIDAVLMDIMMPEMDGYEAMRQIRKQDRFADLPIMALTAKAMSGDKEKCIEAGANDYLAKPVVVDKVLSMLRVWLYE